MSFRLKGAHSRYEFETEDSDYQWYGVEKEGIDLPTPPVGFVNIPPATSTLYVIAPKNTSTLHRFPSKALAPNVLFLL